MGKTTEPINDTSPLEAEVVQEPPRKRARGQKPLVAMTFRLSRQDWERLHLLALTDGVSINTLTLRGLSRLLEERGLPGINIV